MRTLLRLFEVKSMVHQYSMLVMLWTNSFLYTFFNFRNIVFTSRFINLVSWLTEELYFIFYSSIVYYNQKRYYLYPNYIAKCKCFADPQKKKNAHGRLSFAVTVIIYFTFKKHFLSSFELQWKRGWQEDKNSIESIRSEKHGTSVFDVCNTLNKFFFICIFQFQKHSFHFKVY